MTGRQRAWILPPMAVCMALGVLLGHISDSLLLSLAGCLAGLFACLLSRGRFRFWAILALTVAVGCFAGYLSWHPSLPPEGDYSVRGTVCDEIRSGSGSQIRTVLTGITLDGQPFASDGYWTFYTDTVPEDLAPGKQVSFTASLYHPEGASNPDGYDFREELLRRGITVGLYGNTGLEITEPSVFSVKGRTASLRHRLSGALVRALGEEAGGYASTMLLGMRSMIPSEDRDAFSRLGIAHVLSVSGFHTGILVSILALFFRLFRVPQKARLILYAIVLGFYCLLCGMSQPVIRASLLLLAVLGGRLQKRPRPGLHMISAVWILMLLISPVQLTGISFQLTFGAMLGITLVTPYLASLFHPEGRIARRLVSTVTGTVGAQIGILLPELYWFQELPLLGLLVNIPVLLFGAGMIGLYWLVLLTLPVPGMNTLLPAVASSLTSFFVSLIRFLGSFSWITLWTHASTWLTAAGAVLLILSLCILFRFRPGVRRLLAAAAAVMIGVSLFPEKHEVTEYIQFDVSSADAAVLWDRDQVIVMDAGYDNGVLSGFLHRRRLTPDAVILTHLHADHVFGLRDLMNNGIPVRTVYLPADAGKSLIHEDVAALMEELRRSGTEFRTLSAGDTLSFPSGSLEVLWPEKGKVRSGRDANEYSLVCLLKIAGSRFLQAGDLDGRYELYAAAPADLLKVAHHGSASSTSEKFIRRVSPQALLLSCGRASQTERILERAGGIPLYSTDTNGAITVRFDDHAFTVTPYLSPKED